MPALRVMGFDGVIPRTSPTMLAPTQAQVAQNVKLYAGELRNWRGQQLAYAPPGGVPANIKSIYRLYNGAASIWLTSANSVDYVPGPLADTSENRIYYTGEATPRKTNYAMASGATPYPNAYYEMGVPAPTGAPTVAASSSASPVETRAYVYTYVNQFGAVTEESAPSPASALVSLDSGATVTVSGFTAPPGGNYNWQGRNIYRSVAGASTSTYQFVAYIPLATTSYVDSLTVLQLGGVLPTVGWLPPPSGLLGLVGLSNGCLAGFVGNTIWFSQPYYPHAWPIAYNLTLPFNIIGLAAMGSSLVVMTTSFPYVISGSTPGAMSEQQLPLSEPCIAKNTICANALGVLYASPNGLVSIGSAGAEIITKNLFGRDEWQGINPSAMKGISYDGKYFGVFLSPYSSSSAMVLDPTVTPALSFLTLNASAAYSDIVTGNFYIVSAADNNIYQVDANSSYPTTYTWTSKRFVNANSVSMAAIKIDADYSQITSTAAYLARIAAIEAANATPFATSVLGGLNQTVLNRMTVNGSLQQPIPPPAASLGVQVQIYGDTNFICSVNGTSLDPQRLPAFKAREIYFTVMGSINVRSVEMATSVRELASTSWSESAQVPAIFT